MVSLCSTERTPSVAASYKHACLQFWPRHRDGDTMTEGDDAVWSDQLGPAYTATEVAERMGVAVEDIEDHRGLLRLKQRDGQTVYPAFQFDGNQPVDGLQTVVFELTPRVATPWTIASWLTADHQGLGRPIDGLRRGNVTLVVQAARQFAGSLSR
jgi:hypothetical protein